MSKARPKAAAAPTRLVDGAGRAIALGPEIGRGGEGAVHATADEGVVAKVYLPGKARPGKLAAMVPMAGAMEAFAAWPREVLRDPATGEVAGFLMRRASGRNDIHDLYNVKSRRTHFPKADWRFLVHVAANVCRAFAAVHAAGCVIGDVNHGGLRVAEDGTVTLIDCDSFQVGTGPGSHRCEVGVDTFTPPELQGVTFSSVERTRDHDAFGLAVLLFQLLFLGRHPFIGVFGGSGDMDPARAIRENRYAFGRESTRHQMRPPPGAVMPAIAGEAVAELFERAFSPEAPRLGRPGPRDWLAALSGLESSLVACSVDPGHWHVQGQDCPWCRIERGSGVQLFPILAGRVMRSLFDMAGFKREVAKLRHPGALPRIDATGLAPSPGVANRRRRINAIALVAVLAFVALAYALGSAIPLFGIAATVVATRRIRRRGGQAKALRAARNERRRDFEEVESEWRRRAGTDAYDARLAGVRARIAEWDGLPAEHERRMRRLTSNLEADQRERYLDRFPIAKAGIDGIGPIRIQALESFGVSTAADVEEDAVLAVPGFGPKRYEALRLWRRSVERGFVFDPNRGVDPADVAKADAEMRAKRAAVEADLVAGLGELQALERRIAKARTDLAPAYEAAQRAYRQAQIDAEAAGVA